MLDFVTLGHVTLDRLPDGSTRPGGAALFAAVTAARMGLEAGIVTVGRSAARAIEPGIGLACPPCDVDTTFENLETPAGRRQIVHAVAPPIDLDTVPPSFRCAPAVLLGPVLEEVEPSALTSFDHATVVLAPQGWLRRVQGPPPGPVVPRRFRPDPVLARRVAAVVLSVEDIAEDDGAIEAWRAVSRVVVVTRGRLGATLFEAGSVCRVDAVPAHEVDATGAGDVFAAALLVGLHARRTAIEAARFAARVAAASVEGRGVSAIPWLPRPV